MARGIQRTRRFPLSYDGTWFASGNWGGDGVTVWNVPEGRVAHRFDTGGSAGAFFTPEGHSLVVSDHRRLSFYDVGTWRLEHALERDSSLLLGVCGFSPDGRILAYNFSLDTVRLIDRSTGEPLADLTAPDAFGRENFTGNIVFSSDGSRLIINSHSVVQSWNIRHLRECFADLSTDWDPPLPPREPNPHGESGVGVLVSPCEYGDPGVTATSRVLKPSVRSGTTKRSTTTSRPRPERAREERGGGPSVRSRTRAPAAMAARRRAPRAARAIVGITGESGSGAPWRRKMRRSRAIELRGSNPPARAAQNPIAVPRCSAKPLYTPGPAHREPSP